MMYTTSGKRTKVWKITMLNAWRHSFNWVMFNS